MFLLLLLFTYVSLHKSIGCINNSLDIKLYSRVLGHTDMRKDTIFKANNEKCITESQFRVASDLNLSGDLRGIAAEAQMYHVTQFHDCTITSLNFSGCGCNPLTTISDICEDSADGYRCLCKPNYEGLFCGQCKKGYYGFPVCKSEYS